MVLASFPAWIWNLESHSGLFQGFQSNRREEGNERSLESQRLDFQSVACCYRTFRSFLTPWCLCFLMYKLGVTTDPFKEFKVKEEKHLKGVCSSFGMCGSHQ